MATITSPEIVDQIIADKGHYEDDPVIVKIVEYQNGFNGQLAWGVIDGSEDPHRYDNVFRKDGTEPRVIFENGQEVNGGRTKEA